MHEPAIIAQHRPRLRQIAAESMVLLKNDSRLLPLAHGCKVALWGRGQLELIKGGAGSADIFSGSTVELADAFLEAESEKLLSPDHVLLDQYKRQKDFFPTDADAARAAAGGSIAVWIITRNSGEGLDRRDAASVPIIAATANAYQEDIDRVLAAGMNMHLSKPLEVDKLLAALAKYYRK